MLKIGHRGACGHEPENTLRSIKKAIDLGVNQIEIDVHVCKSGDVVVIHDDNLERTTNGKGKVSEMTLEKIRELDAGEGEKIPTLEEVLFFVQDKIELNIEIKKKQDVEQVLEVLQSHKVKNIIISSGQPEVLQKVKKFKTAFIFYVGKTEFHDRLMISFARLFMPITKKMLVSLLQEIKSHTLNIHYALATKGLVHAMHSRGIKVNVWTLNDKDKIKKYISNGVDGIISDYPDRI
ncbi:hypothetical protein HN695_00445 [Candidatus Woesearchaeota archaeon]|jgi:glycerophosphoryl diester phosphodiesterase|nr:hypothetical protein [Candidatus Woesearchaeota archaeon]MBT5271804.1 hypothetical protein [Candidatus Woesearchaeota archaeon]MBT6040677.1 hypothetical protein [Candidatus Woesearchaeota archaeon]MBT6336438.1 hypothetical protein [Candidatus Woesearchaeota archaeon]MBT7926782.1 hypothetical protein [Candidatus Woesearchaeota archaeon]